MEYNLDKMCDWERKKAIFLLSIAEDLDLNLDAYGELSVNQNSGYVYLWIEDYNFSLYMPIDCELKKSDVVALWSCQECGEEEEYNLKDSDNLSDIENNIKEIEEEHNKEKHEQQTED